MTRGRYQTGGLACPCRCRRPIVHITSPMPAMSVPIRPCRRMPPVFGNWVCSPLQSAYRSVVSAVSRPYSVSPTSYSTPIPSACRFQPRNANPSFVQPDGMLMVFIARLLDAHTRFMVSSDPPLLMWKTTVTMGGVGVHCAYSVPAAFSWVSRLLTICLSVNVLPEPSFRVFQPVKL